VHHKQLDALFVPSLVEVIGWRSMEYARPSFERSCRDGRGREHGRKAGDVMVFEMTSCLDELGKPITSPVSRASNAMMHASEFTSERQKQSTLIRNTHRRDWRASRIRFALLQNAASFCTYLARRPQGYG
jgi:hypothetical protein